MLISVYESSRQVFLSNNIIHVIEKYIINAWSFEKELNLFLIHLKLYLRNKQTKFL